MKIAAVICEFNPFHNGHKFLIDNIKKELTADAVIVLMSGDYVERGEPACFSKETRAKMALNEGADLVLMLPTVYSTQAADLFAYSSVYLLNRLNCVDLLVFGSECGDINRLKACSDAIRDEANINNPVIRRLMKDGLTYARARSEVFPEYRDLLSDSNNILAFEYLSSISRLNSKIEPFTVKRVDDGYNSKLLSAKTEFASAAAIREFLSDRNRLKTKPYMPAGCFSLIEKEPFVSFNDFSEMLYIKLLENKDSLFSFCDVSKSLAEKINDGLPSYKDVTSFIEALKSKDLTYARISRSLLHILLGIKGTNEFYRDSIKDLTHLKLLGFSEKGREVLSVIGTSSDLKLTSSIPDVQKDFNRFTGQVFETDLFSSTLYEHVLSGKSLRKAVHEYSKPLIKV